MTLKELNELDDIIKLISRTKDKLMKVELSLYPGGINYDGMPKSPAYKNKMESLMTEKISLEKRLENLNMERIRREEYIANITDYHIRLIIELHFVDKLTWRQVAQRIGGNNTADSVRMLCKRYVENSEK